MSRFGKNLRDDERVIQEVHQHPISFFWPGIVSVILFLAPFFILYPLFGLGFWGVMIFIGITLTGVFLGIRTFVFWYYNFVLLTDQRLIFVEKKKLFEKKIFDVDLENISDVVIQVSGISGSIFNFCHLKLVICEQNSKKKKWLYCVADGETFKQRIFTYANEIKIAKNPQFLTAQDILQKTPMKELFKVIKKIRSQLGDEKFIETLNKEI